MRILFVTSDFPSHLDHVRGVFILRQVAALRDLGHEVEVQRVVPVAPPLGAKWHKYRALGDGYTYEDIVVHVARTLVFPRLRNFEHLRAQTGGIVKKAIDRFQPDVVHAHYLQYPGSIAVERGKPTVITSHGIDAYDWPFRREGLRCDAIRTLARADVVVGVSQFIASSLRRLFDRNVEVVFNGADPKTFAGADCAAARAQLQIPAERRVLAFAGALVEGKGIFDLAAALSRLSDPPLVLVAGEGPQWAEFAAALRTARIEARFFGSVQLAMVAKIFAAADVVTLPSHHEGLPVTICEAMLSGRPVIATRVGGIPEIVSPGETGLLTDAHDIEGLSQHYARLLRDRNVAAAMGRRAHAFASSRLTWEANARAYEGLYRRLTRAKAA